MPYSGKALSPAYGRPAAPGGAMAKVLKQFISTATRERAKEKVVELAGL